MKNRFASTKFLLTASSLAMVFFFAWFGKLSGDLAVLVPAILGMYMAGNVGQAAVDNKYGTTENVNNNFSSNNGGWDQH